jgi:hypothetical protein
VCVHPHYQPPPPSSSPPPPPLSVPPLFFFTQSAPRQPSALADGFEMPPLTPTKWQRKGGSKVTQFKKNAVFCHLCPAGVHLLRLWASICCLSTHRCTLVSVVCAHLFTMRSGTHDTLPCTCTRPSPQWHMIFGRKTGVALPCRRLEFTPLQTAWVVQSGP